MHTRNNEAMERAVTRGVNIEALQGAAVAWAYMAAADVPRQVILRVLVDPAQRRAVDVIDTTRGAGGLSNISHLSIPLD